MLSKGPAKKVTIFINEDAPHRMTALHDAVMTYLLHKNVAGATATRAFSGFGSHHALHSPQMEATAQHLPIRIEFVESAERVEELLPTLYEMVTDGLIEVQDTTVIKVTRAASEPQPKIEHQRKSGPARLLQVFFGEADKWHGEPLHEAIIKKLRMMDIAGVTVARGIAGYGAKGHEHKQSFLHVSRDLPIVLSVIESAEKISAVAEVIEGMLDDGLLTICDVEMVRVQKASLEP